MSEYQRFISYMYEYRNGKKSTNCGYARVENRNRLCRLEIHMKTSPQTLEEPLRIYGCFHQDGQLFGVLLGQHTPVLDMVNWRYQGDPDNLNASMIPLSQLEGLILSDGSQIAYCSMWNDTVIDPNQMTPYAKKEPQSAERTSPAEKKFPAERKEVSPAAVSVSDNIPEGNRKTPDFPPSNAENSADRSPENDGRTAEPSQTESMGQDDSSPGRNAADSSRTDAMDPTNQSSGRNTTYSSQTDAVRSADISPGGNTALQAKATSPADISPDEDRNAAPASQADTTGSADMMPAGKKGAPNISPDSAPADAAAGKIVSAASSLPSDNVILNETAADSSFCEDDSEKETPCNASCTPDSPSPVDSAPDCNTETVSRLPRSRMPEASPADTALAFQKSQSAQSPADTATRQTRQLSPWEQVQTAYPRINPFTDDEIQDCVRIELNDLPRLRQNGWRIAGNRFILHSFQKNRHLVLGRLKNNNRYIFAIPGYYDNQERFMANMFGFPYFKSSDSGPLRYGQKGYWYRLLY